MMGGNNKQAYDAAFQRGREGKSSQSWWHALTTYFEDEYTRQSRQKGERDGAAERAKQANSTEPLPS
jgi:hypothetical protein